MIKYMTDGVLLRETLTEEDLDTYSCVIMDEAHERSLQHRRALRASSRRWWRGGAISSSSSPPRRWTPASFPTFSASVPIFNIPGRTFPVDVLHAKTPWRITSRRREAGARHPHRLPAGDMLIFMTGQEDILTVRR